MEKAKGKRWIEELAGRLRELRGRIITSLTTSMDGLMQAHRDFYHMGELVRDSLDRGVREYKDRDRFITALAFEVSGPNSKDAPDIRKQLIRALDIATRFRSVEEYIEGTKLGRLEDKLPKIPPPPKAPKSWVCEVCGTVSRPEQRKKIVVMCEGCYEDFLAVMGKEGKG